MARSYRELILRCASLAVIIVVAAFLPAWLCGRSAAGLFDGRRETQLALARAVAESIRRGVTTRDFSTGSPRFDGEWALGTHQMAVLGLGQVILEHPETRDELMPALSLAADRLVAAETHRFGTAAWREEGLKRLGSRNGHAYLGYVNLALGMDRMIRPDSPHAELHDRLTAALQRRIAASPTGMIETYPSETYPPDVSSVVGSIGLHHRVTGIDRGQRELVARWAGTLRARFVDPGSGLLVQSLGRDGRHVDHPRASGTAIAAYFLSFADEAMSRELFRGLQKNHRGFAGFGGVREYPRTMSGGLGDIDSGPVVFGVGVSATGFSLASARIHGDRGMYGSIFRTVTLFGAPVSRGQGRWFVSGGPLGNAIMLAMLTAGPGAASTGGDL
jgi:hypothetical protein